MDMAGKDLNHPETGKHLIQLLRLSGDIMEAAFRVAENRAMGADYQLRPVRKAGKIRLQKSHLIRSKTSVIIAGAFDSGSLFALSGRVDIDNIVHHYPVFGTDVHGIIGWAHYIPIDMLRMEISILTGNSGIVVMIAGDTVHHCRIARIEEGLVTVGKAIIILSPEQFVGKVSKIDSIDRSLRLKRIYLCPDEWHRNIPENIEIMPHRVIRKMNICDENHRISALIDSFEFKVMLLYLI